MGYLDDWNEITSDPRWDDGTIPEAKKTALTRKFAKKIVGPEVGKQSDAYKGFIRENIINKTAKTQGASREGSILGGAAQQADNTLTGLAARGIKKALTGNGGRFVQEDNAIANNPLSILKEAAGGMVADLADPIGLGIDALTGGIGGKLVKRVASPLAKGAIVAGSGATSGAIQGGGSAALQGSVNGQVNAGDVAKSSVLGALLGGAIPAAQAIRTPKPVVKPDPLASVDVVVPYQGPQPQPNLGGNAQYVGPAVPVRNPEPPAAAPAYPDTGLIGAAQPAPINPAEKSILQALAGEASTIPAQRTNLDRPVAKHGKVKRTPDPMDLLRAENPAQAKPPAPAEPVILPPPATAQTTRKPVIPVDARSKLAQGQDVRFQPFGKFADAAEEIKAKFPHAEVERAYGNDGTRLMGPSEYAVVTFPRKPDGTVDTRSGLDKEIARLEFKVQNLMETYDSEANRGNRFDVMDRIVKEVNKTSQQLEALKAKRPVVATSTQASTVESKRAEYERTQAESDRLWQEFSQMFDSPTIDDYAHPLAQQSLEAARKADTLRGELLQAEGGLDEWADHEVAYATPENLRATIDSLTTVTSSGMWDYRRTLDEAVLQAAKRRLDAIDPQGPESPTVPADKVIAESVGVLETKDFHAGLTPGVVVDASKKVNADLLKGQNAFLARLGVKTENGRVVAGTEFKNKVKNIIEKANTGNETADKAIGALRRVFTENGGRGQDWITLRNEFEDMLLKDYADANRLTEKVADLPVEDRIKLHDEYTGDAPKSGKFDDLIQETKGKVDPLGKEKERLGLISEDSHGRFKDNYLERLYVIHGKGPFGDAAVKFARKFAVPGDSLKARGNETKWVEPEVWDAIQKQKAEGPWEVVSKDKGSTILKNAQGKQVKAGNVRADMLLNDWEARYEKDGKVGLWRDWTKDEREGFGQIRDAHTVIGKTLKDSIKQVRSGQLFEKISQNAELAVDAKTAKANPEKYQDWVRVSGDVKGTKIAKWGKLDDHYVRPDVYTDLMLVNRFRDSKALKMWDAGQNYLKKIQVVLNPAAIGSELIGNTAFYQIDHPGGNVMYVVDGWNEMRKGKSSKWMREAEGMGLFESEYTAGDVQAVAKIPKLNAKDLPQLAARLAKLPFSATETIYKRFANDAFKLAHYIDYRENQGLNPEDAFKAVAETFYTRPSNAPAMQMIRRFWAPYLGFTVWRTQKLASAAVENPLEVLKLATVLGIFGTVGKMQGDHEEEDSLTFRDDQKGKVIAPGVGPDAMLPLPKMAGVNPDGKGYLDLSRALPGSQMFATSEKYPVPIPKALEDGGIVSIVGDIRSNRERFTGKEIVDRDAPAGIQLQQGAQFLGRTLTPNHPLSPLAAVGLPSYAQQKIGKAIEGQEDMFGRKYTPTQAILSSLGIKVNPVDLESGMAAKFFELDRKIQHAESEIRKLGRAYGEGKMSEATYNRGVDQWTSQIESYAQKAQRYADALERKQQRANAK